ncbi:beta strand repeat-containing protein [Nitrosomonas ureae]|uniref:Calx-beta domain-containing protein n=1 Tax=Nitrosomonas ureae TaxID=44577 RepID=A0A1H8ZG92_9PROT|nr:Calx-beta domain-containing protein [Nitrosomonas ureae]SEP63509.1 Calx-beta domain-containing protein [Nitrosomonas ureae]
MTTIRVDDVFVDESNATANFTVWLDVANAAPVTVNYRTDLNTATYAGNQDFVFTSGTLTFNPGEISKTVSVSITNNAIAEAIENFEFNLSSPSANATIADASALGTIFDNDAPSGTPVVSINDFTVDEATKEATFVIALDRPSTSVVSMNYATQNGTALAGSDFVAQSGPLSFSPGQIVKTVKVSLINNAAFEASEAFNLVLSALTNATTLDAIGTAIIFENDAAAVSNSRISVDDIFVDESQAYADFLVRLDAPNINPVTVNYRTDLNTATYGGNQDFVFTSGTLNFAPGEMVKTVRVTMSNGSIAEAIENFEFNLSSPSANATIVDASALGTIIDNDAPSGTPVVSINDFTVDEATKEATFVIALDRPSTSVVSMNYATQNGTALAGSDFVAQSGPLSFSPGQIVKTVKVSLINNAAFEASEAFNLVLSALTNATTLDAIGTAIIFENDAAAVSNSRISVDDIFVDESQAYADFLVRLDAPNINPVTVNYRTDLNTATYGGNQDFVFTSGTLNFAPGEMVKTVRVTMSNGSIAEAIENFEFNLSSPSANATIVDASALGTIIDNDAPSGTPVVSINDFTVDEATKEATFVIVLDRPSTSVVSMNYATQNGTALAGSDFVATNGSLKFAPGETAKTVKVTLVNNAAFEASEAFNLVLSALTNATTLDAIGTAIIFENDAAAVSNSRISVDDIFVDESQAYADFLVRLDAPNINPVTVNYRTDLNTATYGGNQDFVFTSGTLNFAPGEMVKTVRVTMSNGSIAEAIENFEFNLSSPSANATISDPTALGTIIDNDATSGVPVARITDTVVDETDQTATVTVILDKPSVNGTKVNVAGQNVTANNGGDFRNLHIGTVAFAPGETAKTVTFGLLNDNAVEDAELFDVTLSSPVGLTVGDGRGHVIIAGSDRAALASPVINVANVAASEDKGFIDFQVTLAAPSVGGARVNYSTAAGTASSGTDYVHASGTLAFAPGEVSKIVRVALVNDLTVEALENFNFNLSGAVNAAIGNASASAAIIDNESAAPAAPIAIAGTSGNDILQGTQFRDAFTGGAGNDTFNGGDGNDSMVGGGGNDTFLVENAGDTYSEAGGGGTDLVISYLPNHTLGANVENLLLAGTATTGIGNTLANTITGNGGNNTINGSSGNDILNGAAGSDNISGGTGSDFIVFSTALNAITNVDTLADFNVAQDTIRLENAIFTQFTATGAIPANTLVSGPGAVALDSNDFLIYNTTNGNLSYDADGNGAGAPVAFAILTGAPALTAADFVII